MGEFFPSCQRQVPPKGLGNADWNLVSKGERCTEARKNGLRRLETTFYTRDGVLPSLVDLQNCIQDLESHIPPHLVYSTPYHAVWKAYTERFVHTLVLLNTDTDEVYFVYAQNEITKKNARVLVKRFSENKDWILAQLSLRSHLPINLIEYHIKTVVPGSPEDLWNHHGGKWKNLDATRITSKSPYTAHAGPPLKLEKVGIVPTPTANFYLPRKTANKASRCWSAFFPLEPK